MCHTCEHNVAHVSKLYVCTNHISLREDRVLTRYPLLVYWSPCRSCHATDVAMISQVPKLHSTEPILPHDCSRTPSQDTPVSQSCDARVPRMLGHFLPGLLLHYLGQEFVLNDGFQSQFLYLIISYHLSSLFVPPNHLLAAFQERAGADCPTSNWICLAMSCDW